MLTTLQTSLSSPALSQQLEVFAQVQLLEEFTLFTCTGGGAGTSTRRGARGLTEARLCSDPESLLYRLPLGRRLQDRQALELSDRLRFCRLLLWAESAGRSSPFSAGPVVRNSKFSGSHGDWAFFLPFLLLKWRARKRSETALKAVMAKSFFVLALNLTCEGEGFDQTESTHNPHQDLGERAAWRGTGLETQITGNMTLNFNYAA
ncbi:hypothetical protein JZ751_009176, partial [Albula glossodonta]